MFKLALQYDVTKKELSVVNGLMSEDLYPGQIIKVPQDKETREKFRQLKA